MTDMYKLADEVTERYNQYNTQSFFMWSREALQDFDIREVGTLVELEKRREDYVTHLKELHKTYINEQRELVAALLEGFKAALAEEFLSSISTSISARVYEEAYCRGHSGGFRDVVTEYAELANFVRNILEMQHDE